MKVIKFTLKLYTDALCLSVHSLLEVDAIDDVSHFLPLSHEDGVKTLVFDVCQEGVLPTSLQFLSLEVSDRSLVLVLYVSLYLPTLNRGYS